MTPAAVDVELSSAPAAAFICVSASVVTEPVSQVLIAFACAPSPAPFVIGVSTSVTRLDAGGGGDRRRARRAPTAAVTVS